MEEAFIEATKVKGHTLPNPPVGAVLIKNGKIIGRGGTLPAGQAHAEIVALRQSGEKSTGATLYVTLEPCSHHGRTPPCVDAVIAAGVTRVVAACPDPNPKVAGRGFETLRRAGITVEVGLGRERAEAFYAGFFHWVRTGRPRIVVKIAESLDGRINASPGRKTALTGAEALAYAHELRARADAILVGGKTLRVDDPDLTPRLISPAGGGPAPEVLVLSRHAPPAATPRVFAPGRTSGTRWGSPRRPRNLPDHVGYFPVNAQGSPTAALLTLFRERGYHEVLVEGGRGVWTPFLNEGLCDMLALVTAPVRMPAGEAWSEGLHPGWVKPLEFHRFTPLGRDTLTEFVRRASS